MSGHFSSHFPDSGSVDYSDQSSNIDDTTIAELRELAGRYPQARSALLPMLHLVQSVDGRVSPRGIEVCADILGITTAQVSGVATFYTMYKRRPAGKHHLGVCTTALCAVDGRRHPARPRQAAPRHRRGSDDPRRQGLAGAPRVQRGLRLRPRGDGQLGVLRQHGPGQAGRADPEAPRRRGGRLPARRDHHVVEGVERVLAGFPDGRADEGPSAGPASLLGREIARENNWTAPSADAKPAEPKPEEAK